MSLLCLPTYRQHSLLCISMYRQLRDSFTFKITLKNKSDLLYKVKVTIWVVLRLKCYCVMIICNLFWRNKKWYYICDYWIWCISRLTAGETKVNVAVLITSCRYVYRVKIYHIFERETLQFDPRNWYFDESMIKLDLQCKLIEVRVKVIVTPNNSKDS